MAKPGALGKMVKGSVAGAVTGLVYGGIGATAAKGTKVGRGVLVSAGAGLVIGAMFAGIYHVAGS